jgi:hypothetical protein
MKSAATGALAAAVPSFMHAQDHEHEYQAVPSDRAFVPRRSNRCSHAKHGVAMSDVELQLVSKCVLKFVFNPNFIASLFVLERI